MKKKEILLQILIMILIFLFVYTPANKLMKFEEYKLAMKAQPFTDSFSTFLIYAVPFFELVAVILMAIPKTRKIGLYNGLVLLLLFTGYIVLVQLNYYGRIPCSCGGVISSFTWTEHLVFNLIFILFSIIAILLDRSISKEENEKKKINLLAA